MKKEVENEEIKGLKKKYKKLKYGILFVIIAIIIIVLSCFAYNVLALQVLLKKSEDAKYGDNYKKTMTTYQLSNPENKSGSVIYRKGDTIKVVLQNGRFGLLKTPEKSYQILYESKEYRVLEDDIQISGSTSENNLLDYCLIEDTNSFMSVADFVYKANVKLKRENIDGTDYYVISVNAFEQKIYLNPETYLVDRLEFDGNVTNIEVVKNVVTDEDLKTPERLEFTDITDSVN